jgi:threonine dehydrogenase-like Zn-dependent dehydrogenase
MTDVRIEGPGRLAWEEAAPLDRPPGPGEVRVAVERITLCGSDFHLFHGSYGGPCRYPLRFGHEWSGRVLEAGPGTRICPGTRVTGDCSRWCGTCDRCAVDRNLCRRIEKFGITCDGFSTGVRVVEERYLYPDEHDLGADALALVEVFAVAWRGVARAGGAGGAERVLVVGAGPLGLAVALVLEHAAGREVELAESDPARARLVAGRFGGLRPAPPPAGPDGLRSYADLAEAGRYPVVFDCSGSAAGLDAALAACAPGGTMVAFGLSATAAARSDVLVAKGLTVRGSIGGTGAFPEAMALLAARRDLPERLVTHRLPARQAEAALAPAAPSGGRIKVQLVF